MDKYQNHLVLRMEYVKVVPSHQFCLTCSLMTFLINVINMESLFVINAVVEVSFKLEKHFTALKDFLRNLIFLSLIKEYFFCYSDFLSFVSCTST